MSLLHKLSERVFGVCAVLLAVMIWYGESSAGQFQLSWADNSNNEDGFKIERGPSTTGPFTQIGTVLSDTKSYTDSGLADATTFCYRVRAFNASGDSGYTNVVCATTTATLTVAGSGNGTVTSSPAGINCGTDCSERLCKRRVGGAYGHSRRRLHLYRLERSVHRDWNMYSDHERSEIDHRDI